MDRRICANKQCRKKFTLNKFARNQIYCSGACMRFVKLDAAHARQAKYRVSLRELARKAGLSTKQYLANRFESVGWCYAVDVIRRRCKKSGVPCTITSKFLKELYIKQGGLCPITGWKLKLRKCGWGLNKDTLSIDRIDHKAGYILGNVRLVAFMANNARYTYSDKELTSFCVSVVKNKTKKRR